MSKDNELKENKSKLTPRLFYEEIRGRAYEIFNQRIKLNSLGDQLSDWLQAEKEIKKKNKMTFTAIFMTTNVNSYGYKADITVLQDYVTCLKSGKERLYLDHNMGTPPIGKVINAKIIPIENVGEHAVEVEVELFDNITREEFDKFQKGHGFSPSYIDGGFTLSPEKMQNISPPFIIEYDAYRSDEEKLRKNAEELVDKFKVPVKFARMRRHAFLEVLTWTGLQIVSYLFAKSLEDSGLYESIKDVLLNTSDETQKGKEIQIRIQGQHNMQDPIKTVTIHFAGTNAQLKTILDNPEIKEIFRDKVRESNEIISVSKQVTYNLNYINGIPSLTIVMDRTESNVDFSA